MIQRYSDLSSASAFSVSGPPQYFFRCIMLPSVCINSIFPICLDRHSLQYLFLPLGNLMFLYYAVSQVLVTS